MFSKNRMNEFTENCSRQIDRLKQVLGTADAVLIGAGAGLSASAGLTYSGERFERYFSDFHQRYGITDMYSGGFYPYDTLEEYWAWWSRHIFYNRYADAPVPVYQVLLSLVKNKDYFVLTTNVDHQFQKAGFDKQRLFYTQGDYGLWQCSKACHTLVVGNNSVSVAYGVDDETLENTPGWLETSAMPGEEGTCVIFGHRNRNHLKLLKDVKLGDTIKIKSQGIEYSYIIESISILENDAQLTIPAATGKHLLISTCYPFYYSGSAPQKIVVLAKQNK